MALLTSQVIRYNFSVLGRNAAKLSLNCLRCNINSYSIATRRNLPKPCFGLFSPRTQLLNLKQSPFGPIRCNAKRWISEQEAKRAYENEWQRIKELPIYQRLKTLFLKYWYVAVPVHTVASALWFGSFYLIARL